MWGGENGTPSNALNQKEGGKRKKNQGHKGNTVKRKGGGPDYGKEGKKE